MHIIDSNQMSVIRINKASIIRISIICFERIWIYMLKDGYLYIYEVLQFIQTPHRRNVITNTWIICYWSFHDKIKQMHRTTNNIQHCAIDILLHGLETYWYHGQISDKSTFTKGDAWQTDMCFVNSINGVVQWS